MSVYVLTIDPVKHEFLLGENRKDPITKQSITAGDRIVFCASCESAFLYDSWKWAKNRHCGQSQTLEIIRINNSTKYTAEIEKEQRQRVFDFSTLKAGLVIAGFLIAAIISLYFFTENRQMGSDSDQKGTRSYSYDYRKTETRIPIREVSPKPEVEAPSIKRVFQKSQSASSKTTSDAASRFKKIFEKSLTASSKTTSDPASPFKKFFGKSLTASSKTKPALTFNWKPSVNTSDAVNRSQFTDGIKKTEPEPLNDLGRQIAAKPVEARKVFYFTEIVGMSGRYIFHRWKYRGHETARIKLNIRSDRYRTHSSKWVESSKRGWWTVEVLDSGGRPIHSESFQYK